MRSNRRRGAAALVAVVLLATVAMAGMATHMTLVAAGAARVQHQRDTIQCVYAAESGIELAMAEANRRQVPDQPLEGTVGSARYSTQVQWQGRSLTIISDGYQPRPGRPDLVRRIQVQCRQGSDGYMVAQWTSMTPPAPEPLVTTPEPARIRPEEESR
jgi:hypothetical protein